MEAIAFDPKRLNAQPNDKMSKEEKQKTQQQQKTTTPHKVVHLDL